MSVHKKVFIDTFKGGQSFVLRTPSVLCDYGGRTLKISYGVSLGLIYRCLLIMSLAFSTFPEDWGLRNSMANIPFPQAALQEHSL